MAERAVEPGDADQSVLSVAELAQRIGDHIDTADSLADIACRGEVSDLYETETAVYFTLIDEEAKLDCVFWQNRYRNTDLELDDGLEVVVYGTVDFYAPKGRVNLKPWEIVAVGEGDRASELAQRRAELDARGWFDDEHKRELPTLPACVGLVTSHDGDARYDMQNSIHERYPDVNIQVCHSSVQGDAAPTELAAGIERLDANPRIEVIIVGRGGGSDEDLMAFNTEAVAAAIFHADTPIVTGIGHREDDTIADAVADHAAITPTAAGKTAVPQRSQLENDLSELEADLMTAYEAHVEATLDDLATRLTTEYETLMSTRLDTLERRLDTAYQSFTHEQEKEAAVAAADRRTRQYRIAIAALLVLIASLLLWILL